MSEVALRPHNQIIEANDHHELFVAPAVTGLKGPGGKAMPTRGPIKKASTITVTTFFKNSVGGESTMLAEATELSEIFIVEKGKSGKRTWLPKPGISSAHMARRGDTGKNYGIKENMPLTKKQEWVNKVNFQYELLYIDKVTQKIDTLTRSKIIDYTAENKVNPTKEQIDEFREIATATITGRNRK